MVGVGPALLSAPECVGVMFWVSGCKSEGPLQFRQLNEIAVQLVVCCLLSRRSRTARQPGTPTGLRSAHPAWFLVLLRRHTQIAMPPWSRSTTAAGARLSSRARTSKPLAHHGGSGKRHRRVPGERAWCTLHQSLADFNHCFRPPPDGDRGRTSGVDCARWEDAIERFRSAVWTRAWPPGGWVLRYHAERGNEGVQLPGVVRSRKRFLTPFLVLVRQPPWQMAHAGSDWV